MSRYVLATNNPGKVKEIKPLFEQIGLELICLADLGLSFEPAETGSTFEANAIQKATETLNFLKENGHNNMTVLSDDSGLCINKLDGLPGVDSANYMGRETPYPERNANILNLMSNTKGTKDRTARFECVIACVRPDESYQICYGTIHGEIAQQIQGVSGFGYDPIFFVPEFGKTMAELTPEEKSKISHRGKAIRAMLEVLKNERN